MKKRRLENASRETSRPDVVEVEPNEARFAAIVPPPPEPPKFTAEDVLGLSVEMRQKLRDTDLAEASLCNNGCANAKRVNVLNQGECEIYRLYCEALRHYIEHDDHTTRCVLKCDFYKKAE